MVATGVDDEATFFFFFLGTKILIEASCNNSVEGGAVVASSADRFFSMVEVAVPSSPSFCSCCTVGVTRVGAIFFFFFLGTRVLIMGWLDTDGLDRSSAGVANVTFFLSLPSESAASMAVGAIFFFFFGTNVLIVTPVFDSGCLELLDGTSEPTFSPTSEASLAPTFSTTLTVGATYTSPNSPSPKLKMLTYPSELVTNNVRPSVDHAASVNPA
mmetsp:Transcript_31338/g.56775  ORF Transcript_31338/g.56775 Transcript_31338/m.56775 type:complete len:214 (-) Transcript_31338:1760-2401(-)